jgi:hypothetical protein
VRLGIAVLPNDDALQLYYDARVDAIPDLSTKGDCAKSRTPGSRSRGGWAIHGTGLSGSVACYVDEDDSWYEWTVPAAKVYAFAARNGQDLEKLRRWWRTSGWWDAMLE